MNEKVGVGLPLALHENVTFNPLSTVRLWGCSENSGRSVVRSKSLVCNMMYVLEVRNG